MIHLFLDLAFEARSQESLPTFARDLDRLSHLSCQAVVSLSALLTIYVHSMYFDRGYCGSHFCWPGLLSSTLFPEHC